MPFTILDEWRHAWPNHRVRTIETSPLRLWVVGQTKLSIG